jgi:hypothetical protein
MFLVIYGIAKTIHRMQGENYVPLSQEIWPPRKLLLFLRNATHTITNDLFDLIAYYYTDSNTKRV